MRPAPPRLLELSTGRFRAHPHTCAPAARNTGLGQLHPLFRAADARQALLEQRQLHDAVMAADKSSWQTELLSAYTCHALSLPRWQAGS